MANFTISIPNDPFAGDPYAAEPWVFSSLSGTSLVFDSGDYRLVFTGTGFADGDPPTGTITGATLYQIDMSSGSPVEVPVLTSTAPLALTYAGLLAAIDSQGYEFGALVYLFSGDDSITGSAGEDNVSAFAGNDVVDGLGDDDYLDGGDGNDSLNGGDGNDYLFGGAGDDVLRGGAGEDYYVVSEAADSVVELAGGGSYDKVELVYNALDYLLAAQVENLDITRYSDFDDPGQHLKASGNELSNKITVNDFYGGTAEEVLGLGGNDRISTGAGDDTLNGGAGVDTLIGGKGNDSYLIDSASDVITEAGGGGVDLVTSSVTYTLGSQVELLTLAAGSAINGTGNALDNTLTGNASANSLSGAAGADSLVGLAGADSLSGGGGNDTMVAGAGVDTLVGGLGNDLYVVDGNNDLIKETSALESEIDGVESSVTWTLGNNLENLTLTGSSNTSGTGNTLANLILGTIGNNSLNGAEGSDTLVGDLGNDTLQGGTGDDSMIGGDGNDTYYIDSLTDVIEESSILLTEVDTVMASFTYTLSTNLENLTLEGSAAINGTGNLSANRLIGNTGNNSLSGSSGNDTLTGDAGNDTMNGGTGFDSVYYNQFGVSVTVAVNATSSGGTGSSTAEGIDTLFDIEEIIGSSQADIINDASFLTGIANRFEGGGGADSLDGGDGSDTLVGSAGDDILNGGLDRSTVDVDVVDYSAASAGVSGSIAGTITGSNTGSDTVSAIERFIGTEFADNITGTAINETLEGRGGNDTLASAEGNDTLDGGTGADSLTGGTGDDTYYVDNAGDVIVEAAAGGIDTVLSTVSSTLASEVDRLTLTGIDDVSGTGNELVNTLTGNIGKNLLRGLGGNDSLVGGDGDDTLAGGIGSDTLVGGNGIDTLDFSDSDGAITGSFGSSTFILSSSTGFSDSASTFENVIGSTFSDALTGDSLSNLMTGGTGNDTLIGGSGNDTILGGSGSDSLDGGSGTDQVSFANNGVKVTVDLFAGTATGEGADTLAGFESVLGTAFGDTIGWTSTTTVTTTGLLLLGGAGADSLTGSSGADTLDGGTGADTLTGGIGSDTYYIDSLNDVVVSDTSGTDTLISSVNVAALDASLEYLTLLGSAVTGAGNIASNRLIGNEVNNNLSGDLGLDSLTGGLGADTLSGGIDIVADRFVYLTAADSTQLASDVITDYDSTRDIIDLAAIDANTLDTSTTSAFTFIGNTNFTGAAGELRSVVSGDGLTTLVQGDVNGDAVADFWLQLVGNYTLESTDFSL